jgi:hypothetical protein
MSSDAVSFGLERRYRLRDRRVDGRWRLGERSGLAGRVHIAPTLDEAAGRAP